MRGVASEFKISPSDHQDVAGSMGLLYRSETCESRSLEKIP